MVSGAVVSLPSVQRNRGGGEPVPDGDFIQLKVGGFEHGP